MADFETHPVNTVARLRERIHELEDEKEKTLEFAFRLGWYWHLAFKHETAGEAWQEYKGR